MAVPFWIVVQHFLTKFLTVLSGRPRLTAQHLLLEVQGT